MLPVRQSLVLLCILALVMLACGASVDFGTLPFAGPQLPLQGQVSTSVAQTMEALTLEALSKAATAAAALPTATPTPTNTPLPATLSVSAATNCYAGPRTNYGFVITIRPGTIVTVEGKDTADNYWIIDVPDYPGTVCWLSGEYASVVGDTANLSSPATPLASIYTLSEPKNLRISCDSDSSGGGSWWDDNSDWTVVFRWTNTEPHQAGVRVYRNGWRIATLGGHASSFTDAFRHHDRRDGVTYGVQAYSGSAVSSIVSTSIRHCR